jgi:predicted DNA-binding transcriptional regulator YafY
VPRNQEVIRQWKVLHALEASRHGVSIDALAGDLEVTTRTIRRDLAALQEAGFPLFDERDDEGRVRWRLDGQVLHGIETGFTLAELCALYLSRNLLEAVAGTPFQRDLTNAFARLERMLSPRMRQFLDRLPSVLAAKPGPRARDAAGTAPDIVGRLLEGTLHCRAIAMRYHSVSSGREKDYLVHPYRLAFAQGALYLLAFVPEYGDIRTFAVDRIASVSLEKQTFTPQQAIGDDVFANSLGVNTGPAEPVEIEFDASVAPYVRARVWHATQQLREEPGGRVVLAMEVCHDWALRSWILSWGPFGRVRSPHALARTIATDLQSAEQHYRAV